MVLGVKLMMVISHCIGSEKVTTLLKIAVVGKFQFKVGNHDDLLKWVDDNWKPFFGYFLVVHILVKG